MVIPILYRRRFRVFPLVFGLYTTIFIGLFYFVNIEVCPTCSQECTEEKSRNFPLEVTPGPSQDSLTEKNASKPAGSFSQKETLFPQTVTFKPAKDSIVEKNSSEPTGSFKFFARNNITSDTLMETRIQNHLTKSSSDYISNDESLKIDWNDYEFIAKESSKQGPGEQGVALLLPMSDQEREKSHKLQNKYKFNAYISDRISLERAIGDWRSPACKLQKFLRDIPDNSVSFITVFHNEKNSTLLRTIHNIINRSPAKLVREIILVDDLSTDEELLAPLDLYIGQHFRKVKVIRNQERLGLIKSRMRGADASSGNFLLFLDAHIEVTANYLPPLLEPLILNYRTISCPVIHAIDRTTFKFSLMGERVRGAFDWSLVYKRIPTKEDDETTPFATPVMVGCAFAITRRWWEELGKYDPGLEIWGAEQYELSFKSWQCGGRVVDAPCSLVGHLFRPLPYSLADTVEKNYLRLAAVWMDEYKDYVFKYRPRMQNVDAGNISKQLELRKRLNCKPFKWFMEEVAPDILHYYPPVEPPVMAWGQLWNKLNSSLCVTVSSQIRLESCNKEPKTDFVFDWRLHIRPSTSSQCFANTEGKSVFMWDCIDILTKPTESFVWDRLSGHIVNIHSRQCLDVDKSTYVVIAQECDKSSTTQSWSFAGYNITTVDQVWTTFQRDSSGI